MITFAHHDFDVFPLILWVEGYILEVVLTEHKGIPEFHSLKGSKQLKPQQVSIIH
jgi:hypothetical protein